MSLFNHSEFRAYLRDYVQSLPKRGRGEISKIAKHLEVNTTLLSQILSGTRSFNPEQTLSLSRYLGHNELETEYFSVLIQHDRAGTRALKQHLEKKREQLRVQATKLSQRVITQRSLTDVERAIFYSSWLYSAVHLFCSTNPAGVSLGEVAERFLISNAKSAEVLKFLAESGICIESNGRFQMGAQSTFVPRGSPFLLRHHSNWRIKAIQKSETIGESEMMYTGQHSLSLDDFQKLSSILTEFIKNTHASVKDSPAEDIACLNIDWFWIDRTRP